MRIIIRHCDRGRLQPACADDSPSERKILKECQSSNPPSPPSDLCLFPLSRESNGAKRQHQTRLTRQPPSLRLQNVVSFGPSKVEPPCVPGPRRHSVPWARIVDVHRRGLMSTVLNRMPPETYQSPTEQASKPQFPGIPTTSDGAGMVVWVDTHITQGACAYPITSSTTMGGGYQVEVANGKRNLWGDELAFIEPESEHSAASTCEGFAVAGGRVTNFTSGQGLILMKEVLYTISGKRLPVVFHIGARALTSHSLNVHAGHDDVYGVSDCGWGVLYARNAQEAGDLALIARRTAEDTETPFLNVQDGFLTTHTIENVRLPEPDLMKMFVGHPSEKIRNLMDPRVPLMSGVVQNQDAYMKGKIAQRRWYDRVLPTLKGVMDEYTRLTGRKYDVVMPYRLDDAEYAIVGSGCMIETAEAVVDWIREDMGVKVGLLHVTCWRP